LRAEFNADAGDFIGHTYPERSDKRAAYCHNIAKLIVNYVFGPEPAADFCRRRAQKCAVEAERASARHCDHARGELACFRARPRMIVIIAHERVAEELTARLGRACLILPHGGNDGIRADAISGLARKNLAAIDAIGDYLYHLPLNEMTPLLPKENFQKISGNDIAGEAQARLNDFLTVMNNYQKKLYDKNYVNPKKKYMRGAYKLDGRVGFQRDRLHDEAQFGAGSRSDLFHLINAHHFFGAAYEPGRHFDVTAEDGRALGQAFRDILTGATSETSSRHENITPCDRVLGAL
jgi:hypothetical protein